MHIKWWYNEGITGIVHSVGSDHGDPPTYSGWCCFWAKKKKRPTTSYHSTIGVTGAAVFPKIFQNPTSSSPFVPKILIQTLCQLFVVLKALHHWAAWGVPPNHPLTVASRCNTWNSPQFLTMFVVFNFSIFLNWGSIEIVLVSDCEHHAIPHGWVMFH